MGAPGVVSLSAATLALLAMAPAAAERPTPPSVRRFAAALTRGDLNAAQRLVAPDASIQRDDPAGGFTGRMPISLAEIVTAVRGCTPQRPSSTRALEDPRQMHVFLAWGCGGNRTRSINLDAIGGRLTRVEIHLGPPIPVVQSSEPLPLFAVNNLARGFLYHLVGDRDFDAAGRRLTAAAQFVDRRSRRRPSLASIANSLESCGLREIVDAGNRAVVTHWACPDGVRSIAIAFDGNDVSRIEILPVAS